MRRILKPRREAEGQTRGRRQTKSPAASRPVNLGTVSILDDRVFDSGHRECAGTQCTGVAATTRNILVRVARPGQMQGRGEIDARLDNVGLGFVDEGCLETQNRLRTRPQANCGLERLAEAFGAVGVAGAVFFNDADEDRASRECLRPGCRQAEEMCVSEGDVGDWDGFGVWICVRYRQSWIRERGASDLLQESSFDDASAIGCHLEMLGNRPKSTCLALLGSLAVGEVEQGKIV